VESGGIKIGPEPSQNDILGDKYSSGMMSFLIGSQNGQRGMHQEWNDWNTHYLLIVSSSIIPNNWPWPNRVLANADTRFGVINKQQPFPSHHHQPQPSVPTTVTAHHHHQPPITTTAHTNHDDNEVATPHH